MVGIYRVLIGLRCVIRDIGGSLMIRINSNGKSSGDG